MVKIVRDKAGIAAHEGFLLLQAKGKAEAAMNKTIGGIRSRFITDLPGQDMVYQRKEAEALAYLAMPVPPTELSRFPFLAAEVGITAPNVYQLAQVWVNMASQLSYVAAMLERIRMTIVLAIEGAKSEAELNLIADQLRLTLSGLFSA